MLTTLTGTRNSILKLEVDSKAFIQRDAFLGNILGLPAYKINEFIEPLNLKFLEDKNYGKKSSFLYTRLLPPILLPFAYLRIRDLKLLKKT